MRFKFYYFAWSIFLFLTEIYIALYIQDDFIRPYIGDTLVVILLYSIVKTFFSVPILTASANVLLFSFGIEILQYFKIVEILGLQSSKLARTVIGTSFAWADLLAYSLGFIMILCCEQLLKVYKTA
jgi:Protein of unknown function (DUF2809)